MRARSVSPGSAYDGVSDHTPGVFLHARPLQEYTMPASYAQVFFDEQNDDLVFLGAANGKVAFSRSALTDDSKAAGTALRISKSLPAEGGSPRRSDDVAFASGSFIRGMSMRAGDFGSPLGGRDRQQEQHASTSSLPQSSGTGNDSPGRESAQSPMAVQPDAASCAAFAAPESTAAFHDVLVLSTRLPEVLMAKRPCTRTSPKMHGGVAAVLHDPFTLAIYNALQSGGGGAANDSGTAPSAAAAAAGLGARLANTAPTPAAIQGTSSRRRLNHADPHHEGALGAEPSARTYSNPTRDGPLDPVGLYQCRPKNVRFGNNAYPIRDFFWMPAPVAWASAGTKLRAPSATQALLVVNEICIDIVQVFPFANKQEHATVVLQRITTRTDFCVFDRFSRVLVSVNARKPNILKPLVVVAKVTAPSGTRSRDNLVSALAADARREGGAPEGSPDGADAEVALVTSAGADGVTDPPNQVVAANPAAAGEATFTIAALPQITLEGTDAKVLPDPIMKASHMRPHPLQLAIRAVTLYNRLFVTVTTTRQEVVMFEYRAHPEKPLDFGAARFDRTAVLCLQESKARHVLIPFDNLLLAHCVETGLVFVFDIHTEEPADPQTATPLANMQLRARAATSLTAYSSPGVLPGLTNTAVTASAAHRGGSPAAGSDSPADGSATSSSFGFRSASFFRVFAGAPKDGTSTTSSGGGASSSATATHVPVAVYSLQPYSSDVGAAIARDLSGVVEPLLPVDPETDRDAESTEPQPASGVAAPGQFKDAAYYTGSSPIVLDRKARKVYLLGMNHVAVASSMHQMHTRSMRYLSSRTGAAASVAAVKLLKKAIFDQEPLAFVGRMFDIATERDYSAQAVSWHASNVSLGSHSAARTAGTQQQATRAPPTAAALNDRDRARQVDGITSARFSGSAAASTSSSGLRLNPVAADGQFHIRRALPSAASVVVGDPSVAAQVIPAVQRDAPRTAENAPLSFLQTLDAEQGIETVEMYVRTQRQSDGAASIASSGGSRSGGGASPATAASGPTPIVKLRLSQSMVLRLVFDPAVELLRAKRDQELELDETLPRTQHYLRYLRAVLLEYCRAVATPRPYSPTVALNPEVQALVIDLCTMTPCPDYFSLHQMLVYRVIQDSTGVAARLLSLADSYPPAFQASLDMFSRLKAHDRIVEIFLRYQMPERAAKYAVATQCLAVGAAELLDAALQHDDEADRVMEMTKESALAGAALVDAVAHEKQRKLRPQSHRSSFAQVFAMLRPRLRVSGALLSEGAAAGGASTTALRATSQQTPLSPTTAAAQQQQVFPISVENFTRFADIYSKLQGAAVALSR